MYAELLADPQLHALLLKFDEDLAAECRALGCPRCAGKLHSARYPRKPRGAGAQLPADYGFRFSFCCAIEGCRKRATPASLRYLGRNVYLGAVVVLITAMRCGPTPARLRYLEERLGVSRRTIYRWRIWWREVLPGTPFWRAAGAAFIPPLDRLQLPAVLLERFAGSLRERLLAPLRFLTPLTTSEPIAVRAL
jgi:hypothetical protein